MTVPLIHWKPKIELSLTEGEARLLHALASAHYDVGCRSYAAPHGFCTGLLNSTINASKSEHPWTYPATYREVDTLAKICEAGMYVRDSAAVQLASDLRASFLRILRWCNANVPAETLNVIP